MAANAHILPEQLIYLIIRFTASVPDLPLTIHTPRIIATLSLKQIIRQHLPPEHVSSRLRLIYAGKVLADNEPLSRSLRLPLPSPFRTSKSSDAAAGGSSINGEASKSKGKQPLRETPTVEYGTTGISAEAKKYYIHCSLGDALSASELASEATLAQNIEISLKSQLDGSAASAHRAKGASAAEDYAHRPRSSTATSGATVGTDAVPQAQGFDRLLSSGFTPAEVASLRSHFTTNLSFTHTPDTMPTPAQVRVLEDRWLDSSANDPSASLAAPGANGGETGWGAGFAVEEGYLTGFFFPLGSLVWGFREEGVWTRRRQVAVVMGVLINAVFGFMRWGA